LLTINLNNIAFADPINPKEILRRRYYTGVIAIDRTPPSTPVVIDDGQYTTSSTQLHASWSSSDPESGINGYQYAIGTSLGATDVVRWTFLISQTEVTHTGLNLTEGQNYYFTVKARNGHGFWSQPGNSDGIILDTTPPIITEVIDDGSTTYDRTQLHATWQGQDDGAPIEEYQYSIGTGPSLTDVLDWTSVGLNTEITATGLSLIVAQTYYFNLKARNAANFWSDVNSSDGIAVLNQSPQISSLLPDNSSTFTEQDTIDIEVQAQDPDQDDLEYRYLVDGGVVQDWIPLNTYSWQTQTGDLRLKTITTEVRDEYQAMVSQDTSVFLFRRPPEPAQ